MSGVIVIPARYGSTRFPGKPLALIAGVSLIRRVYERAMGSRRAAAVFVATDDPRIADHVTSFGGRVVMPEGDFQSGTDRIAAALKLIGGDHRQIVNIQGDEPMIDIARVDTLFDVLTSTGAEMATLACPFSTDEEFLSRDIVKVVVREDGIALYFSRAPIGTRETAMRHIGVYAYTREAIERFVTLPPSPLERAESLEQLRALQHGFRIAVSPTPTPHQGVDRPEDVLRVERELMNSAGFHQ